MASPLSPPSYIDDVLVHSKSEEQHKHYQQQDFQCLSDARLTLRATNVATLGMAQVTYFGHKFTQAGLTPDTNNKVQAVQDWPTPTNVSCMKQFLRFPSHYRC